MHYCEICEKEFTQNRHLKLHIARQHVPKSEWQFECNFCTKKYADGEILRRHMKLHNSKRPKLKCLHADCDKEFLSEFGRSKHVKLVHELSQSTIIDVNSGHSQSKKQYRCSIENCGFSCSKHHILTQHSYKHTGILPFECSDCDKRFLSLTHKIRHEKVHKGYKCDTCEFNGITWTDLQSHKAINHAKEYKCQECDKIFYTACRLKQHAISHSSERPVYKCQQCEADFTRKHALKIHINVVHKGIREFRCTAEGCSKVYAHRHSLTKHIKQFHRSAPKVRKTRKDKIDVATRIIGLNLEKLEEEESRS